MTRAARVGAVLFPLLLAGCEGSDLVTLGPTPPDQGIIIYIHADFVGSSQAIDIDVRDLTRAQGPCSSGQEGEVPSWASASPQSVCFPGGRRPSIGMRTSRGGASRVTSDTPDLRNLPGPCDGGFNDCITSIRVTRQ